MWGPDQPGLLETLSQNKIKRNKPTKKPTRDRGWQTFSIPRRSSFCFKTIHLCLCICFQSDTYLYLRLELGVFVTQQLVPLRCLDNKTEGMVKLKGKVLSMLKFSHFPYSLFSTFHLLKNKGQARPGIWWCSLESGTWETEESQCLSSRLTWSTHWVPGHPRLQN